VNDDEFFRLLGFTSALEREICKAIRHATAAQCKIDDDLITPHDETAALGRRTLDGWDDVAVMMHLERSLGVCLTGVQVPNFVMRRFFFFFKRKGPVTYGEWVKSVVGILTPVVAKDREGLSPPYCP
jgi:hypothetical protein